MNEIEFLRQEIYNRYGSVTRARGCFLYTSKNQRLTDLYQENGRSILGWGGGSSFTMLKNTLNRGITGSFITDFSYRLQKAVSVLLNSNRKIYTFTDKSSAVNAASILSPNGFSFYKPWVHEELQWSNIDAILIEPPLPWTSGIYILAVIESKEISNTVQENSDSFRSSFLPAPIEAAVSRSIYNLIQELPKRNEKNWFLYDKALTPYWERRGPYLAIKKGCVSKENYKDFICHCLDTGIVINPVYEDESIVPFGADPGVFSKFIKTPFNKADN